MKRHLSSATLCIHNRVLVTGAAGFIGSHTVDCLLKGGFEVIAVDNFRTGKATNIRHCVRDESFLFEFADVSNSEEIEALCYKYRPQTIIHLAGLVSVVQAQADPDLNYKLNIETTHVIAEAARKAGVPRVVFASSAAIYGDCRNLPVSEEDASCPISLYGMAKRTSEQILEGYHQSFGIECLSLRFFNVFGPRQDPASPYSGVMSIFADRFAKGEPIQIFGDGSQTRDFISVYEVARSLTSAATVEKVESSACNICTGSPVSLLDIVTEFREMYPDAPEPEFLPAREGEILHSAGSPDSAARLFGFQAETSLRDGIRALVNESRQCKDAHARPVPQVA